MKALIIIPVLFLGLSIRALSQEAGETYINPNDPAFTEKYDRIPFKGRFAMKVLSDEWKNYYIADFSKLPGRFEKTYFLELVYHDGKIVNLDGDISKERIWFQADRNHNEKEILDLFNRFRETTLKAAGTLSPAEKEQWMKKAEKFTN